MEIIYAICSWGLGHSTRSLPVIRKLIEEENNITVISNGRALELLKKELGDNADFIDIVDYPILISENARQFMAKSMIYWPLFIKRIESGLQKLKKILYKKRYDLIVSDGRYDMYDRNISSYFISHQMRIMNPLRIKMFETGSEIFNRYFFNKISGVIVPDYKDYNFSGDLSHNLKKIDEDMIHYVGALSDFRRKSLKKDIDYFISISGPEPQRSMLEDKILTQVSDLEGNIVMTLGKSEKSTKKIKKNLTTYSFLTKDDREDLLNKSKLVIARSGYSTILDLGVIGAKALLIPTPGQIEQEYLGQYHNLLGTYHCVNQSSVNLKKDVKTAKLTDGFKKQCDVDKTVENILRILY